MFYTIGNIFTGKQRQAEQTDTRQAIQRHDPEFERKRGKKEPKKEELNFEDGAIVSVEALKDFLQNFIKERNTAEEEGNAEPQTDIEQPDIKTAETPQPAINNHSNNPAAHAASAYAQSAHINDHDKVLLETTDQADGPSLDLSSADIRTIHALIDDLKILDDANIEILKIERASSFLESLQNAVSKAKLTL